MGKDCNYMAQVVSRRSNVDLGMDSSLIKTLLILEVLLNRYLKPILGVKRNVFTQVIEVIPA